MDTKKIAVGMTPEALEIFSKKLSLILEKRDTSLAFLCYNVGVPTSTLHDLILIGTGVGKKSIHYLEAVCEYLGTDLESMIKTSPINKNAKIIYSSLEEIKGRSIKKIPENIEGLKRQCREMSSERLKVHLNNSNVKEKEVLFKDIESENDKSQDEFFSVIAGDLDYARCSLKTFFDREEKSDACELVSSITGDNVRSVVSFGTEAGLFQEIGISTVVCGPGSIEQAHKVDEYIKLDELKKCLNFLEGLKNKSVFN